MAENSLIITPRQEQQIGARQLQSLGILELPSLELEARMRGEMAENPVLEELPPDDSAELPPAETPPVESEDSGDDDRELTAAAQENDDWREELPLPMNSDDSGGDPRFDRLANTAAPASGSEMRDELAAELASLRLPPKVYELALRILDALEESGYLKTPLAEIAMAADATLEEAEAALRAVQSLDPAGIAARSLRECLKLQLERTGELPDFMRRLLDEGWEDLEANRVPQLAKRFGVSVFTINAARKRLAKLDGAPGRLSTRPAKTVIPELEIRRGDDGVYTVRLLRDGSPRVVLSERYLKMIDDPATDPETREYLREKIRSAKELLQALADRKSTLLELGEFIARRQRDFFEYGVKALRPLTMKEAAAELGCHETTVSRAAKDKYAATPRGVKPLGYFFTGGVAAPGNSEGALSNRAVTERIRELIAAEDPRRPLSDDAVAEQLRKEGIEIARRTVAKYREAAGIPKTSLRRRHV